MEALLALGSMPITQSLVAAGIISILLSFGVNLLKPEQSKITNKFIVFAVGVVLILAGVYLDKNTENSANIILPSNMEQMKFSINFLGSDFTYHHLENPTPFSCQSACSADKSCIAWTFRLPNEGESVACALYSQLSGNTEINNSIVSGKKR